MKTFLILLLLPLAIAANAATVTFGWDPSPSTNAAGYTFYASTNNFAIGWSTNSPVKVDAGTNTIFTLSCTNAGHWYFSVTAYGQDGTNRIESDLSNVLSLQFAKPPTNFYYLVPQYTATLGSTNWMDLGFFRLKIGMP